MKPDHRHALVMALEGISVPSAPRNARFLNAVPIPGLEKKWKDTFLCEQGFKSDYLRLLKEGFHVEPEVSFDEQVELGVFLLGKNRRWNEYQISRMWNQMKTGSRIVVAGGKNEGIGSIRKWFSRHARIRNSFSKYHSIVFQAEVDETFVLPELKIEKEVEGYAIAEGVFSSDGPDIGSKLLLEFVDHRVSGKVADLGAGWGYLSCEFGHRTENIAEIDLFEADLHALRLAERNIVNAHGAVQSCPKVTFNWIDVLSEFPKKPYDWVVMNPPFHSGRAAEPQMGQRFIEVAASTLRQGGHLLMVANKNLPYERTLEAQFRSFEKLAERDGFKVFEARR